MTAPSPFHEIQFPTDISNGASGGPGFNTTVLTLASGFERRNVNWSKARAKYDVSHGVKTQQQMNALISFLMARNGKAYGFRYKDWADFKLPNYIDTPGDLDALPTLFTTVGVIGGGHSTFQLVKVYGDTSNTYTRTINKPFDPDLDFWDSGSQPPRPLALYDNGTPCTPVTDFTVDTTTGIVTLSVAIAATTGHVITGSCDFMTPVRFDVDDLKAAQTEFNNFSWDQIPLVEVRV
jgi:uncharacterized protein (TIGR02217 family)